jgi:hypothetical protein
MYATCGDEHRAQLFRTRRVVRALIRRGLMEEAGTSVSETYDTNFMTGQRIGKGYTRTCKAYRLTPAGRILAEKINADTRARVEAVDRASPEEREKIVEQGKAKLAARLARNAFKTERRWGRD